MIRSIIKLLARHVWDQMIKISIPPKASGNQETVFEVR